MIRVFFIFTLITAALIGGAFFAPHSAKAQTYCSSNAECTTAGEICDIPSGVCVPSSAVGTPSAQTNSTATQSRLPTGGLNGDGTEIFGWLWGNLMNMFAALLGYAGVLLNNTVHVTVLHMGLFVNNLNAVGVVWTIMRDLSNLILIFGFIAVGVCYILGVKWYGGGTTMIPTLLLAAIFVNFSLFITEAVIDVGNIFAAQVYTQINGGNPVQPLPILTTQVNQQGISNIIMGTLGLQALYNNGDPNKVNLIGFLSVILFIVAAFVMFSLAFMLIARFVTLIFLIIVAPIGFAGLAVPKLDEYAKKWWDALIKNTISAPILLLMLYIALTVITDRNFLGGFGATANGWTQLTNSQGAGDVTAFAGILLSFLVAMGLLLACTYLANSMSVTGASWATKWGGRMSFGLTAYGMSGVFGGTARLARSGVQRYAPKSKIGQAISRGATRSLRAVENSTFDMRSIPGAGTMLGAFGAKEAATPVKSSVVQTAQKTAKWYKGEEEKKKYDQETRLPRLKAAIGRPDPAEVRKIMRSITDEEMKSPNVASILKSSPLAVQSLTNHQVTLLSDSLMTNPNIFQNLSIGQLEAYRSAGNVAPGGAGQPLQAHLSVNQYDPVYMAGRNPGDQVAIRSFWHI